MGYLFVLLYLVVGLVYGAVLLHLDAAKWGRPYRKLVMVDSALQGMIWPIAGAWALWNWAMRAIADVMEQR